MSPRRSRRPRSVAFILLAGGFLGASLGAAAFGSADRFVHRRAGLAPWRVERVAATADALVLTVIDRGLAREDRIAWDRVAAVDPKPDGSLEVGVDSGLRIGDRIWRGVRRLQRGDARLARVAFEEALDLDPRMPGPLAATVLEGLVLAGVAGGDTERVLAEAVLVGDLAAAGVRSDRFTGPGFSGDAIDRATSLVPEVPPVAAAVDSIELRRRLRETPRFGEGSDLRRDLWMRLVQRSGPPEVADRGLDEGSRFLLDLTRLDSADPREREVARQRLLTTSDDDAAWRAAWIRWFAGSAAIAQAGDDADAALAGVLDLTHVLALEDAAPASLRRASLELAASTLARIGRTDDAGVLDSILTFERPGGRGSETAP